MDQLLLSCGLVQVIDAEMQRRKLLEDTPIDSIYGAPVNFDTQSIPWWAWVRRFHLPEVGPPNPFCPVMLLKPPPPSAN